MTADSYSRARRRDAWEEWPELAEPARVRQLNGVTQAAIGKALSVDHRTISQWENGRYFPHEPLASAYRRIIGGLARHLEVPEGGDDARD